MFNGNQYRRRRRVGIIVFVYAEIVNNVNDK